MKNVIIIDALNMFLRSYVISPHLDKKGYPVGGTIGFLKSLQKLVPSLTLNELKSSNCGIRAQACDLKGNLIDDFVIESNGRILSVINAPSPAATSSFSIGMDIMKKIKSLI